MSKKVKKTGTPERKLKAALSETSSVMDGEDATAEATESTLAVVTTSSMNATSACGPDALPIRQQETVDKMIQETGADAPPLPSA